MDFMATHRPSNAKLVFLLAPSVRVLQLVPLALLGFIYTGHRALPTAQMATTTITQLLTIYALFAQTTVQLAQESVHAHLACLLYFCTAESAALLALRLQSTTYRTHASTAKMPFLVVSPATH